MKMQHIVFLSLLSSCVLVPTLVDGGEIARWRFDGDVTDSGAGNNHGTFVGGTPVFVADRDGTPSGALRFDGVDDLVAVTHSQGLPASGSNAYTIAFWVKAPPVFASVVFSETSSASDIPLLCFGTDTSGESESLEVFLRDGAGTVHLDQRVSALSVFDDTWHHVAWVSDGGRVSLYIDGTRDPTDFDHASVSPAFDRTTFGAIRRVSTSWLFQGVLDDARVFDHALTRAEVRALIPTTGCPASGDTTCEGLEITGPAGGNPGIYLVTATAADVSGDAPLFYTFTADDGAGRLLQAGPQTSSSTLFDLPVGDWTLSVEVDDDLGCFDDTPAAGAVCQQALPVAESPGLIAYWPFDGDLLDAASIHDGTFTGTGLPSFANGWDGTVGGALDLAGRDGVIEIDPISGFSLYGRAEFTLTLWFRGPTGRLLYEHSTTNECPYFDVRSAGGFGFSIRSDTCQSVLSRTTTTQVSDNTWHHAAVVRSGSTIDVYIDGALDATEFRPQENALTLNRTVLGGHGGGGAVYQGAIDDVMVFNYALSQDEVEALVPEPPGCPGAGDTTCDSLVVTGPVGNRAGTYTATATASDSSGDSPLLFTFRADDGMGRSLRVGPQTSPSANFELDVGAWTVSVLADDDLACHDDTAAGAATCQQVVDVVNPPRRVSYWTFDRTLRDAESSGNHGTYFSLSGGAGPIFGEGFDGTPNGGLLLDGAEYVEVTPALDLPLYNYPGYTVALWVKGTSNNGYLYYERGVGQSGFALGPGTVRVYKSGSFQTLTGVPTANGLRVADGTWHHIAWVDEGGAGRLYFDGIRRGYPSLQLNYDKQTGDISRLFIGGTESCCAFGFTGLIDDLQVFNYALTDAEIRGLIPQGGCPAAGDTHCGGVSVALECPSTDTYRITALDAFDETGDTIEYTFTLENTLGDYFQSFERGRNSTLLRIPPGIWTVSVAVDDHRICQDEAPDAIRSTEFVADPFGTPFPDCNGNGEADSCDILSGRSGDCDGNGVPNECEPGPDCNGNGVPDACDIAQGYPDVDLDSVIDECQQDCDGDGVVDRCETDCNAFGGNCNVAGCGQEPDCNFNGIPDGCEPDCDGNGVPDACDPEGTLSCINPNGWIQSRGWNLLMPIAHGESCSAGGEPRMALSWLCPHDLATEDPRAGDLWDDIDFGGCSPAFGHVTGGVYDAGRWVSLRWLDDLFNVGPGGLGSSDRVDFQNLVDRTNNDFRHLFPGSSPLPSDDVLAIVTTYVENVSGGLLELDVCVSSDDSLQLWLNDQLLDNVSACRTAGARCDNSYPVALPPGVSRISAIVWEGVGGWGLYLGLRLNGTLLRDGNGLVEFLGTAESDPGISGQRTYSVTRSALAQPDVCAATSAVVTLDGEAPPGFPGTPTDPLVVVEELTPDHGSPLSVSAVSQDGTVEEFVRPQETTPQGFIRSWLLLGPFFQPNGAAPALESIRADYLADGAGIEESTIAPIDGETVQPDYGGAAASEGLAFSSATVNPGGVPRWSLRVDPDDTINFQEYYGSEIQNVVMYAVAYVVVDEDVEVDLALASDDSIQVLIDGIEVHAHSIGRGMGATNEVQDVVPLGTLTAGLHRIMVKLFNGAGGHGFRLRLQPPPGGERVLDKLTICHDPSQLECDADVSALTVVTWAVQRSDVDAGLLSYHVSTDVPERIRFSGRVIGETGIAGDDELSLQPGLAGPVGDFEKAHDIGAPPISGSTSYDPGTSAYTLVGSGADIWDDGDSFHFAYSEVTGDFMATARVVQVDGPPTGRWGKFGIMARYTCDPDSKYSMAQRTHRGEAIANEDSPRHAARLTHRTAGLNRDWTVPAATVSPSSTGWIRLTRHDSYFLSEFAEDAGGQPGPWIVTAADTHVAPPDTLFVGFACSSHQSAGDNVLTVLFDNWSVAPYVDPGVGACVEFPQAARVWEFDGGIEGDVRTESRDGEFPAIEDDRLLLTWIHRRLSANGVYFSLDGQSLGDTGFTASFDVYCFSQEYLGFFEFGEASAAPSGGLTFGVYEGSLDAQGEIVGTSGQGLGFNVGDRNDLPPTGQESFAVEIDYGGGGAAWRDPPGGSASSVLPAAYHVGIDFHQDAGSVQTNSEYGQSLPAFVDSEEGILMEVRYVPLSPSTSRIDVWITDNDGTFPRTQVLSAIGPKLDGEVFVGFSGSTDLTTAQQLVDNFSITPICCTTGAAGDDCNSNGLADACEIAAGGAGDCDGNGVPDTCDIQSAGLPDCNANGVPDSCDIADGTSTDIDGDTVPDDCEPDVRLLVVPVLSDPAGTPSSLGSEPVGAAQIGRGVTFWAELWASDVGERNSGLVGVYTDVELCDEITLVSFTHDDNFPTLRAGDTTASGLANFGGSALPNAGGVEPEWVRVGWLELRAAIPVASCSIALAPAPGGIAAFGEGEIAPQFVQFGSADVAVVAVDIDYDLDGNGNINAGDLGLFAPSWLMTVPPADIDHDFDCDAFVGVGDLSWFATGWLKPANDPTIAYAPCAAGGGAGAPDTADVEFELVAVASPSASDTTTELPTSLATVPLASTYWIEAWVRDVGTENSGLTSAYIDIEYPPELTTVVDARSSAALDLFATGGVSQPGLVDELGGSNLPGGLGVAPQWLRVGVVEARADAKSGGVLWVPRPSSTGVAARGRGVIQWSAVALAPLRVAQGVSPESPFRRGDTNNDGAVNISDPQFALNYLFLGGPRPPCLAAANVNGDGDVNISDPQYALNFLFLGGPPPPPPFPACGPPSGGGVTACDTSLCE